MTTQPPDPGDERTQPGDVTPPDPSPPAAPPPVPPPAEYPPMAPSPDGEHPTMPPSPADGYPTVAPPPAGEYPTVPPPPVGEYPPPVGEYPPMAPPPIAEYGHPQPVYGAVQAGMYYDQESGLMLPQGTQLASVGRRIGAFFLGIGLSIITLGIGYLIWGLIVWANGQTPALQVLGMRCWRPETGRIAGWWWMALREIAGRIAENVLGLITGLVSLILMCVTRERKSLHDFIAGTVVLHDPGKVLPSWPPVP